MLDLEQVDARLTDNVADATLSVMEMTLVQAADRLHVSTREAQRLAATGQLNVVRRVGRSFLVDDTAVTALERRHRQRGRTWLPTTAWAAIELLDHGSTLRLTGSTRSRLKGRLRNLSVADLVRLASHRATVFRCRQDRPSQEQLRQRLVMSGASALDSAEVAARFGLSLAASDRVEGYVEQASWIRLRREFGLQPDAEGKFIIHVAAVRPFVCDVTTALDLVERGTTRERSAAERRLERMLRTDKP